MRIKILLVLGIVIVLGCALSWTELTSAEGPSPLEVEAGGTPTISMDFKDANLKDILKIFSQQSGLNFIASERIKDRKVTLYLDNVSVRDALDAIIRANRLFYEQAEDSEIFIVKELVMPEVEVATRVYPLNYANATKTAELLQELIKEREDGADEEEREERGGVITRHGSVIADERTNSLIITDIPTQFPIIEKTIAGLDSRVPQVMIETEILEVSLDAIKKLGIEWGGVEGRLLSYTGPERSTTFPLGGLVRGGTRSITLGALSVAEFPAIMRMLTKEGETRHLARPRILTLNNETATIEIGIANPVVGAKITRTGEGAAAIVTEEAERMEDVGMLLKVTPRITEDGFISMLIEPEVSEIKPSAIPGFHDKHKRSVQTSVRVKDGETVVIGGLISTADSEVVRGIPLLSNIPLLGSMFKHRDTKKIDTELIIFITPHIVKDEVYLAELPSEQLWLPGKREQEPLTSREEAMEKALSEWER